MVMPMNSFGMNNMSSGNVYQQLRATYNCGYIDNAERPKVAGYPVVTNPKDFQYLEYKSQLSRFIHRLLG